MSDTYVLVHGAWHTGAQIEPTAALIRKQGHKVHCPTQDTALPHGLPWHPRLSERLGLFRLVECPGSHEIWFTDPATIAKAIVSAGRD
jgi:hypothetical protein